MKLFLTGLLCAVLCAGCASTNYKAWHGGGVQTGPGGAMEVVQGVEVWTHGRPNRPYVVVGVIEDTRPGGIIPMAQRAGAVAKAAKAKGGDGLIVVNESRESMGTYNTMNAYSTLNATTNVNANTQFYPRSAYTSGQLNTTGTMNTFGSGMSVPLIRAHGFYQVFRYVK